MIGRFDKETIDLVDEVSKEVAAKLGVSATHLCFATGASAINNKLEFCFETDEDDTYAMLTPRNTIEDIRYILRNWMINSNVKWFKNASQI